MTVARLPLIERDAVLDERGGGRLVVGHALGIVEIRRFEVNLVQFHDSRTVSHPAEAFSLRSVPICAQCAASKVRTGASIDEPHQRNLRFIDSSADSAGWLPDE